MLYKDVETEIEDRKELYAYQKGDIDAIFDRMANAAPNYHLLYQLPTGGGKTVIFSEIVRRYLADHNKRWWCWHTGSSFASRLQKCLRVLV